MSLPSGALYVRHLSQPDNFPFFVDTIFKNILSREPCVQIPNCFRRWIYRIEFFETKSQVKLPKSFFPEKN